MSRVRLAVIGFSLLLACSVARADTVYWASGLVWRDCLVHDVVVDGTLIKLDVEHEGTRQWVAGALRVQVERTALQPTPRPTHAVLGVSMKAFLTLRDGMSYDEVREIVGVSGMARSGYVRDGAHYTMYSWENEDGSNMNVIFRDEQLLSKAQFGLK